MHERNLEHSEELVEKEKDEEIKRASSEARKFSTFCIEEDCGEEIPADRQRPGVVRCITCQEIFELKHKRDRQKDPTWNSKL